ncbi:MAG: restriction endonuclease subunit S [Rhodocyclaceae bacterium]|jgi:restriction endonuclease S subunit|nr:restriction endonuclease subunit S [Rhodocyclaceae bacterium]
MTTNLLDYVDIQGGHPFRGGIPADLEGNAYALQIRDASPEGVADWAALTRTSLDGYKNIVWLRTGDIVFAARGQNNYALCLDEVPVPAVCSQYFFLLRVKSSALLPGFLAWQMNRQPAQRYFSQHAEGSDQIGIRRGILEALPIVVPSIERQQGIAALDKAAHEERKTLQALIRNREQLLDALAIELHNHPIR